MRKLLLLIVLSWTCHAAIAQEAAGRAFINHLFSKAYSKAYTDFGEEVKGQITESDLKAVAQQVQAKFGKFQKIISVSHKTQSPYTLYNYYTKFEQQAIDIQLTFSEDQKIVGFFFLPHQPEVTSSVVTKDSSLAGDWYGNLTVMGMKMPLVFHFTATADGFSGTMDSPQQQAFDLPINRVNLKSDSLTANLSAIGATYTAIFKRNLQEIEGQFVQNGFKLPLTLTRHPAEDSAVNRPQEPQPPFPYTVKEVEFTNLSAGITLAGTLTLPKKGTHFPAVILISGSGPQDRDETLFEHKPFWVIADYLTHHGIAVLRYDDRGVGASGGKFKGATSADFATDVAAGLAFLHQQSEIDSDKIGLIGHSEGGMIAPMVAAKHSDVDFIVLLAGPGVRGDKVLLKQQAEIAKAMGINDSSAFELTRQLNKKLFQLIVQTAGSNTLKKALTHTVLDELKAHPQLLENTSLSAEDYAKKAVQKLLSPWMCYFITYDPATVLQKVDCPVLALNGGNDLQVDAQQNLPAIKAALAKGGNQQVTLKELPGLNHLFQESDTGLPSEYGELEETFSPKALQLISDWILNVTK